ncbi:SDR family oxidoreductase, partial [Acinetobacter baumannii]
ADFLDLAEADFDRVLRVNLKGSFLVGQAVARRMVEQVKAGKAPGAIVNMSSVNAVLGILNQTPYCVSKGGVRQLT